MDLLTTELEKKFAEVGEQIGNENPLVIAKFFTPWSNWTRFCTEYHPESKVCYGFVEGLESEWGYFALPELENLEGPWGLSIERDLRFKPCPFFDIKLRGGR